MTLARLAAVTGGSLADAPDDQVTVVGPVAIDSRSVHPGGLFVALKGERVDGHGYAAAAVAAGAAAVLASRPVGVPAVVVHDVPTGLDSIAHAALAALADVTVVGLTGSAGKTTTKDLVAALLTRLGPTVATPQSFNNEIGHPYTVLLADESTRYLVLEKGARGSGHIAARARVARPRIGAVLNVGTAHIGEFGSREAIAAAKGELVEALPSAADGGVAILAADDPLVAAMAGRTTARVVTAGQSPRADVRGVDVTLDASGRARYVLQTADGSAPVRLRLVGAHQVGNSLIAAAVALELGLGLDAVATTLSATAGSRWRMELTERPDGVTVVNDAYNANPESTAAALRTLAQMAAGRRSVAVLGEMAELGAAAAREHSRIGALATELGIDRVITVGAGAEPIAVAAGGTAIMATDVAAVIVTLATLVRPGDVVLVKGSRVAGLERVAAALTAATGEDGAKSDPHANGVHGR